MERSKQMSCLWFSELLGVHTYKDTNIFLCVHARSKMTSAECISVLTDGQYQKSPAVIAYQGIVPCSLPGVFRRSRAHGI